MPPSVSDAPPPALPPSTAFDRLDARLQRWVWERGWTTLHDIQEAAIDAILNAPQKGAQDVIIMAATAGGKTEAAFLPICSHLAASPQSSLGALYVAPLKALINDQHARLRELCERLDIPLCAWHGDIGAGPKQRFLAQPGGILLITPEALEALFVRQGSSLPSIFGALSFVVIDELHSFLGTERGRQLQSLLRRLEAVRGGFVPRIGLSATLGDLHLAAAALRPDAPQNVRLIQSQEGGQELRCQIRGYRTPALPEEPDDAASDPDGDAEMDAETDAGSDVEAIAAHLFAMLRGTDNLIFANRRSDVELYADRLARLCADARVPNEFFPHHGSLARDLREGGERRLKASDAPASAVCTSTLEMGIDIGTVASIAQIGPPPSVASLRQRLGRSGRRGEPAVLRVYIREPELTPQTHLLDRLRPTLFEAAAMLRLLAAGWCEPPAHGALHLSTLTQQTLSVLAQYGGAGASFLWELLCRTGPFGAVTQSMFAGFLRALAEHDLVQQSGDGVLALGRVGERLVNFYGFYAAFATPDEYRLVADGKTLGTLPVAAPLTVGMLLLFAGRRWRITELDDTRRVLTLEAAAKGRAPSFHGLGPRLHPRVRQEMKALYAETAVPAYCDPEARRLLAEGRDTFREFGLERETLVSWGDDCLLFHWSGDKIGATLSLLLRRRGLFAMENGPALLVASVTRAALRRHLRALAQAGPVDGAALAALASNPGAEKYDRYLPDSLRARDYASQSLDPDGAWRALSALV